MSNSLENLLSDAPAVPVVPDAPEPETAPEPAAITQEPADARPRGSDGKFVTAAAEPTPEPVVEPVPDPQKPAQEPMTAKEKAYYAAAMDERRKRQDLERRLSEATKQPPEEPKQFWDDPEAALNAFRQEVQAVQINTVLNTTEALARSRYSDFGEKLQVFGEVLQQTPGLQQQWLAAPDPAEFAYRTGKNHLELREAGNLDSLRAKIEAEARVKIEQEFKAKAEAGAKARSSIPGTLSDAHNAGGNRPVWNGPSSLDSILGKG